MVATTVPSMGLIHGAVGLTASDWQAIGTMLTLAVAVAAAGFAFWQVREARNTRRDQSQPQVVVDFGLHLSFMVELVISNIGTTTARNVKLDFDPPLASTIEETTADFRFLSSPIFTDDIPTLPPGKEYHILFENGNTRRNREDLPASYEATVTFADNHERVYTEKYILDFRLYYDYIITPNEGLHEISQALNKVQKALNSWSDEGSLGVISRDGDKRDSQWRQWIEEEEAKQRAEKEKPVPPAC